MKEKKSIVKNLIVEQEFMDVLEQKLVNAPSNWLLIRYDAYEELHYEKRIYRFYNAKKLVDLEESLIKNQNLFSVFTNNLEQRNIDLKQEQKSRQKNERPSYKKLNKQMIKSMKKKENTRGY